MTSLEIAVPSAAALPLPYISVRPSVLRIVMSVICIIRRVWVWWEGTYAISMGLASLRDERAVRWSRAVGEWGRSIVAMHEVVISIIVVSSRRTWRRFAGWCWGAFLRPTRPNLIFGQLLL